MDGRHEEQESQYGALPEASLGLERLILLNLLVFLCFLLYDFLGYP